MRANQSDLAHECLGGSSLTPQADVVADPTRLYRIPAQVPWFWWRARGYRLNVNDAQPAPLVTLTLCVFPRTTTYTVPETPYSLL